MGKALGLLALFIACSSLAFAQSAAPNPDWQKIRDAQPKALHLKLTLAKDRFFQGEKIEATVDFSNDDAKIPYGVEMGCGEPGATFAGWDDQGHPLINPLQWIIDWVGMNSSGPVGFYPVGNYSLTLPINENIRFEKPGVYKIYAQAWLIQSAEPFKNPNAPRVEAVSDPVTVTITPLSPEQEKQTIAAAKQKIGTALTGNYNYGIDAGAQELNFLQTPAARAELVSLLANPKIAWSAAQGLESAPNPPAEAEHILAAVQSGKLTLDETGIEFYTELRLSRIFVGKQRKDFTEKQAEDIEDQRIKVLDDARKEITDALIKASGNQGPTHVAALWTAFEQQAIYRNPEDPDKDCGKARAAVAEHQLELPPEDVKRLFDAWHAWGSADFLPLVRREVKANPRNPTNLVILASISPDEARPLIIDELSKTDSKLLEPRYPSAQLLPAVKPMPLPQFDSLFKTQLAQSRRKDGMPLIPLIGCFGSDQLLPGVVEAFHQDGAQWNNSIKQNLYLYWLRCNPKGGASAFEQEITSHGRDGQALFINTLRSTWREEARPVVYWALTNPDVSLAANALFLLNLHGNDSDLAPMMTVLDRLQADKTYSHSSGFYARNILNNPAFHPTPEQKQKLESYAATAN